ncbi:MAG: glycosyltransferase family 39 protein [Prochloraceae cyanobacterium]|nr:glycosyltransferase family 39 protein [Prochloraceae cyanobacterium]
MKKFKVAETIEQWWQTFEKDPKGTWIFSIVWLATIVWIAFLWNLGNTGLIDETEPLFAEAARQMTVTGNWITPYFNGETRFDKPPLVYWLMAIGYKLFGLNSWTVRFPSVLAAIALTVLGFYILRYFGFANPAATQPQALQSGRTQRQLWLSAWIGSALIAFNMETLIWARLGVSDMLLSGCMGGSLFCFFHGYVSKTKKEHSQSILQNPFSKISNSWYLAFYILLGLAVLTKGPVGIVLPGLIICLFLLYVGKFRQVLAEMGVFWGGLIFLLMTVPWYVLVILENGSAYINSFFGYHNFERFTSVVNDHWAPWYFYFLIVLGLFAPWSIYLPLAIARQRVWQRNFWVAQPRYAQLSLFALFWFAVIFIFFSISVTKLPSYVLPLMPAGAILVALLWSEELTKNSLSSGQKNQQKNSYGFLLSAIVNILFLILLAIAFVFVTNFFGPDPTAPNLRESLRASGLTGRGGIIWATTAAISIILLSKRERWGWLSLTNCIGFVACFVFVVTPAFFMLDNLRQLPLRQLSQTIVRVQQPGEDLWAIGIKKPSIVFYTQRPVQFFKNQFFLRVYAKDPENYSKHSDSLLILSQKKFISKIPLAAQDYESLNEKGAYELIRVAKEKVFAPEAGVRGQGSEVRGQRLGEMGSMN